MYKLLIDCQKCEHYNKKESEKLLKIEKSKIVCGRLGRWDTIVRVRPSFYNKPFANGETVIDCHKEDKIIKKDLKFILNRKV